MENDKHWHRDEINVRPTKRNGWWQMIKFSWDALFVPNPYPDKREDEMHRGD